MSAYYAPIYFHNQSVFRRILTYRGRLVDPDTSKRFNSPPPSSRSSEANRGGLNKIFNELKNNNRAPRKDQTDIVLNLNDPIYQCPPPTPDPTPTNPYYSSIPSIDIIP